MITTNIFQAPAGKAKFVGQVFWNPPSDISNTAAVPFDNTIENIVLLDVSGSMGQNVRRIITEYLPEALGKIFDFPVVV